MRNCILVNTLIIDEETLVKKLTRELHVEIAPLGWCPRAYYVECDKAVLTHSDMYAKGYFYLQNTSSLIPVHVLNPQPGESILDLAAAPGGKTIHIGIRMENNGLIIANDSSASRVQRMKRLLDAYQISIVKTTCTPGQKLWEQYPETFDRILVDAPCSMRGTSTPSTDHPKDLAKIQRWLLRSAYSACKPRGLIVYATCTTTVEENEEVIDWILGKEEENLVIEEILIDPHIAHSKGSEFGVNKQSLDPSLLHTIRITQDADMEGFFVAKLRKNNNPIKHRHI